MLQSKKGNEMLQVQVYEVTSACIGTAVVSDQAVQSRCLRTESVVSWGKACASWSAGTRTHP